MQNSGDELIKRAIKTVEEEGIVFIDEIDKICGGHHFQADASDEGVQRDLLPIIEGTKIKTEHGEVDTSKILFITAGAFLQNKPSDLLAELLGRLPIRVKLSSLTREDLYRILVEPEVEDSPECACHNAVFRTCEQDGFIYSHRCDIASGCKTVGFKTDETCTPVTLVEPEVEDSPTCVCHYAVFTTCEQDGFIYSHRCEVAAGCKTMGFKTDETCNPVILAEPEVEDSPECACHNAVFRTCEQDGFIYSHRCDIASGCKTVGFKTDETCTPVTVETPKLADSPACACNFAVFKTCETDGYIYSHRCEVALGCKTVGYKTAETCPIPKALEIKDSPACACHNAVMKRCEADGYYHIWACDATQNCATVSRTTNITCTV